MKNKNRTIILLGVLAAISMGGYLLASKLFYGIGFPLDDAWIHQTYARNLARGEGWSFLPGEPSAGLTAPLWAALLAPGHLVGAAPFLWTYFLGWLILWGLGIAGMWGWAALSPHQGRWTLAAGILIVSEWHLVWAAASGMETLLFGLFVLVVLISVVYLTNEKKASGPKEWLVPGLLIGASAWIRPEGITLLGPVGFVLLFQGIGWKEKLQRGGYSLIGFLVLFLTYLSFNRWLAGAWWPNTFYAKQAEYAILTQAPLLNRLLREFMQPLIGVGVLLLPGFIYLMIQAIHHKKWGIVAGGGWVLGHLSLYAVRLPVTYQHGRYVMPVMAVYFLWGLAGISYLIQAEATHRWRWVLSRVWAFSIILVTLSFWKIGANGYAEDVGVINSEMVTTANWIAENSPEESLIASHDIGALGYFAERPLLDLAGLVSPDVIPFIRNETRLAEYMNARNPAYLVTFPDWYPELVLHGELVYQTQGEISSSLGGENMAVYRWP